MPATILYEHLSEEANVIISTDKRGLKYFDKNKYQIEVIDTPKLNNILILPLSLFVILILTVKSFFLLKKKELIKFFPRVVICLYP